MRYKLLGAVSFGCFGLDSYVNNIRGSEKYSLEHVTSPSVVGHNACNHTWSCAGVSRHYHGPANQDKGVSSGDAGVLRDYHGPAEHVKGDFKTSHVEHVKIGPHHVIPDPTRIVTESTRVHRVGTNANKSFKWGAVQLTLLRLYLSQPSLMSSIQMLN